MPYFFLVVSRSPDNHQLSFKQGEKLLINSLTPFDWKANGGHWSLARKPENKYAERMNLTSIQCAFTE
jgi:hypothetical protein